MNWRSLKSVRCGLVIAAVLGSAAAQDVDFRRDVLPILSENCLQCHGPDEQKRKAGRRLDTREGALASKKDVRAVIPGHSSTSEMITRILSTDEDEVMPPPKTGKTITKAQVDILKRWIDGGAPYVAHWAYVAPLRPKVPAGGGSVIDALVRERLTQDGLVPAGEADRAIALRRLSLDLVGLPPTPTELDAFLANSSPDAYAAEVDRLLASPRFGEKWARQWLDAARYADSDGYEKDLPRSQWPWRDWVIKAMNDDMPYDRFIIEQVAGDLLPHADQDQRVATGFLRNGMVNEEGAIIAEQFRMDGMFDRMDCIGKSVLGITINCAQCHTHKFDPLTHVDYYRMFACINDTYDAQSHVYTTDQLQQIAHINQETARLEAELKDEVPDWQERIQDWSHQLPAEITWQVVDASTFEWLGGLAHPYKLPDRSILSLGFRPTVGELVVTIPQMPVDRPKGLRFEALTYGDLPFGGPGRSRYGTFAVSELEVQTRARGSQDHWTKLKLINATADYSEPDHAIAEFFRKGKDDKRRVGSAAFLCDGDDTTAWGADRGPGRRNVDSTWVAQFAPEPAMPPGDLEFRVTLKYRHGGDDAEGRQNQFLGRFRLAVTGTPTAVADPFPASVREALRASISPRTPAQEAALFTAWREQSGADERIYRITELIDALWRDYPEGDSVLSLAARSAEDARTAHVLERGAWDHPGMAVSPGVPEFLHQITTSGPVDRLAFARWLVDRRSPTTARVLVNRVWQMLFGRGLVESVEDLGVRSAPPTHPELLDWLAVEFMEPQTPGAKPWSLKSLLRQIVMSHTYRQESRLTPLLTERDPHNLLLARGPRFRADAEVVRDIALSVSGLLHEQLGGPSIFPPVPAAMLASNFVVLDWKVDPAPQRYRRSLYVFRRRSMPDPLMASFDAPPGESACTRRNRSNTPLAALAGLNEPVLVEAAQALAGRILREGGADDAHRAAFGFRLCTGRMPEAAEVADIERLLAFSRQRIDEGWLDVRGVATGDLDRQPDVPAGMTPAHYAIWTVVARVLLNLDETLTKN